MKNLLKRLKSKTYWLAIFVTISSNLPNIRDLLADHYGVTAMIIAVAIAALREVTTKPVNEK